VIEIKDNGYEHVKPNSRFANSELTRELFYTVLKK